jgi:hypothetical protein
MRVAFKTLRIFAMEKALRLPPNLISDDHRQRYKAFCEKGEAYAATDEQQRRMKELDVEFRSAAFGHIDNVMQEFSEGLGSKKDIPIAFTFGTHLRSIGMFAALWTEMRTAIAFNREERLKIKAALLKDTDELKVRIELVELQTRACRALVDNLLKRVDALESQPKQEYKGVWASGAEYGQSSTVTHAGSAWIAWRKTREQPGTGADWQLMVKKGRDGKDAR